MNLMKRTLFVAGATAWAALAVMMWLPGQYVKADDAVTPGSLVIRGEYLTPSGCLAFLNDAQALKKTGSCSLSVIALGVKLTDLTCSSIVSQSADQSTLDTVVDCTYSAIKKLPATFNATPATKPGTTILTTGFSQVLTDGCFTQLNHPALRCGFNVNLIGVAIPNMTLSSSVSGGNTVMAVTYPPVK